MTLGEFRKLTKDLPDDTEFLTISDNYELKGSLVKVNNIRIISALAERKKFVDDFDGIVYTKEVFKTNRNGKKYIKLGS